MSLRVEFWLKDVSDGACPVCRVSLLPHGTRLCCPCGGCSFRLEGRVVNFTRLRALPNAVL